MEKAAYTWRITVSDAADAIIEKLRGRDDKPAAFHVVTYGCQMNARDGETIANILTACGIREAGREAADFLIFNTCCVRDNAERRALGNIRKAVHEKRSRPELMIAVCGCMAQESGDEAGRAFHGADLVFGTHNLRLLPEYLLRLLDDRKPLADIWAEARDIEDMAEPGAIHPSHNAFVIVTRGCDNYCSYCVLPYVSVRERSRPMADILRECETLRSGGVREVTLLGQNVNSYRSSDASGASFADLLRAVADTGVERVRFMTSHPKDLSDALISTMADTPAVCGHIHLPAQSGSDRILSLMNRCYTRERYLSRINALRRAIPDVGITTDLIVGFPGETDKDFKETLSLVNEAGFDAAYTFIYSPRKGTAAAGMPGRVSEDVSRERITRLIEAQEANTARALSSLVGSAERVLVDESSRRDASEVSGKIPRGVSVTITGGETAPSIGSMVDVMITSAGRNTLRGKVIQKSRV
jgi:tRNA-2-methylthio-N6-dimethylallyladenosine synthase